MAAEGEKKRVGRGAMRRKVPFCGVVSKVRGLMDQIKFPVFASSNAISYSGGDIGEHVCSMPERNWMAGLGRSYCSQRSARKVGRMEGEFMSPALKVFRVSNI